MAGNDHAAGAMAVLPEPHSLSAFLSQHPQPAKFVKGLRYLSAASDFILRLPEGGRPKAYPVAMAVARDHGFAMHGMPEAYGDEAERALRHYLGLCLTLERELAGPLN